MAIVLWQQYRADKMAKVEPEPDPMQEHPRESRKHAVTKQTP
jgi:hypothetical protein